MCWTSADREELTATELELCETILRSPILLPLLASWTKLSARRHLDNLRSNRDPVSAAEARGAIEGVESLWLAVKRAQAQAGSESTRG